MSGYRVAFVSLGCDKNRVNTEQMMALVEGAGHILVADPAEADVAVLNTCSFIDSAKEESISHILSLDECRDTGSLRKILVAGCLPQRYGEDIFSELPEV
ncbi:MAG TPA: 30S ribosomal protein S12 methylthiotransferase RimO, partial [Oscillospiraceae bacterium]|nr:30S ribosomal protein S12 methylthiotransferase RimO [Oscillospiraceae bacterium]